MPNTATTITPVTLEIANLRESGFGIDRAVYQRAELIRELCAEGDHEAAEKLADEVEALQDFHYERMGITKTVCAEGDEEWVLTAERWVETLIGAYNAARRFQMTAGATKEQALANAQTIWRHRTGSAFPQKGDVRLDVAAVRRVAA
jgi:1-deoxy-D-xylulose 5-phosphate reductoisomerase